ERHPRTLKEGTRYQDGIVVREAGSDRHAGRDEVSSGRLSRFRIRFRVDESREKKGFVVARLLKSEHEAIHSRATKARLGSLKVQQSGECYWRRPRVMMLYRCGGDRWTDRDPKERENQHGCTVSTIHVVPFRPLRR